MCSFSMISAVDSSKLASLHSVLLPPNMKNTHEINQNVIETCNINQKHEKL